MWDTLKSIGRGINLGSTSGLLGGPVDMATMLLNNPGLLHPGLLGVQGLGIKDPVGGSKWIEQKLQNLGLLPQRQGNWQEGVGELASTFINPMTAAAVAGPKLYAAEQRAIENAMAPTTLNKQAGAIVWHGSPHKFDKFDSSKIGTGEGAQAYGHGLYLAESPDVAKSYMGAGTSKGGAAFENRLSKMMERAQDAGRYGEAGALEELLVNRNPAMARTKFSVSNGYSPETVSQAHKVIAQFEDKFQPSGLYKVDLPDSAIARMLDWDKPLIQQAPEVQAGVKKTLMDRGMAQSVADYIVQNKTGRDALSTIGRGKYDATLLPPDGAAAAQTSAWLQQQGIPGIRYLDGGSRGAGSGTSNFVVFPGNEDLLRILERNGQPIGLLGR
jgi:hypothetical protein